MRYALLLLCLLCSTAQAQLTFEPHDPGITEHLTAYKDSNPSSWWSWGVSVADIDGDGKQDIYVVTHHAKHGLAYIQQPDGQFLPLDSDPTQWPAGRPPLFADFTGNGKTDVVTVGDESPLATKLQQADGTWTDGRYKAFGTEIIDLNGNGLLDARGYAKSWGVTTIREHVNQWPEDTFESTTTKVEIPDDLPQPIKDQLLALEDDRSQTQNRYAGPRYWQGDLNGNGREDMVVQYGGSYGGGVYRFGHYLLRDENGVLQDVTDTCGIVGGMPLLPPVDTHNNGRLSILTAYGSTAAVGLQVQGEDGQFTQQTDGRTIHQTKSMWRATYHGSEGYFPRAHWVDLNGNGWLDCIVHQRRLGHVRVFENVEGDMTMRYLFSCWDGDGMTIGDIDGDGKLDIVIGHSIPGQSKHGGTAVTVWKNTSDYTPEPEEPEEPDPPIEPDPVLTVTLTIDGVEVDSPVEVLLNGNPVGEPGDTLDVIIGEPEQPQAILVTPDTIELVEQAQPDQAFVLQPGQYRPFTIRNRERNTITADGLVHVHGGTSLHGHGITVRDSDHITIDGLTVSGGNAGIGAYHSHHLTIRNCVLRDNRNWGLFTSFCDDTVAESNRCYDNIGQHGIYVSNSSQRPVLTGNTCSGHSRSGIQINADRFSGGSGVTRGAIVSGNKLINNRIGFNLDGCSDSAFENNYVGDGMRFFKIDGAEASSRNTVRNNLIFSHREESGVLIRNGSVDNVLEGNTIYLPIANPSWTFAVSVEEGSSSSVISRNNVFAARPFGGGQWGKDKRTLEEMGDEGSVVR